MKHYVYAHILPETGEIIYIGVGTRERAYASSHRKEPHLKVLNNLMDAGYTPSDYVVILAQGLSKSEAHTVELSLIDTIKPMMNWAIKGASCFRRGADAVKAKLTEADVLAIRSCYALGHTTMRALGSLYGVDSSTISSIVNRRGWTHI